MSTFRPLRGTIVVEREQRTLSDVIVTPDLERKRGKPPAADEAWGTVRYVAADNPLGLRVGDRVYYECHGALEVVLGDEHLESIEPHTVHAVDA